MTIRKFLRVFAASKILISSHLLVFKCFSTLGLIRFFVISKVSILGLWCSPNYKPNYFFGCKIHFFLFFLSQFSSKIKNKRKKKEKKASVKKRLKTCHLQLETLTNVYFRLHLLFICLRFSFLTHSHSHNPCDLFSISTASGSCGSLCHIWGQKTIKNLEIDKFRPCSFWLFIVLLPSMQANNNIKQRNWAIPFAITVMSS